MNSRTRTQIRPTQPEPHPPQNVATVRYVQVDTEHTGQRLDNFLLAELRGLPRSLVYRVLRTGEVRVNKGRAKADYRVCVGDQIRIPPLHMDAKPDIATPPSAQLRQLEAAILYEDNRMLVLNKPAGLAVHGGSGMSHGVIEAFRVLRTQDLELVHRLDRDTSGCLILSKRRATLRWLHQALREGTIYKRYAALLTGQLECAKVNVDAPLLKNTLQSGERVVRVNALGKPSKTQFRRVRQFTSATLVDVHPQSGRTHQIRVHAAHLGLPIAGDEKYGQREVNAAFKALGLRRLFLHAASLSIPLPDDQGRLEISAPLDPQLDAFLQQLA